MITAFIIGLFAVLALSLFAEVTAAVANTGGYTAIPEAVREFYSKEVLYEAQPKCRFLQFAKVKRDLQAVRGKSITFTKYGNLSGGGSLNEDDKLAAEAMVASEVTIAVKEQANAIELTEFLMRTSLLDVLGDASKLLASNLATTLDKQFRDTCLGSTNIVFANGAASTSAMAVTDVFNAKTIKDAVEILATNNTPMFTDENGDQFYVCIAHPKQLRQLRDDSAWERANQYNGRRQLYKGEVGMFEGVVFIDSTNMPYLTSAQVKVEYGGTFTPPHACEAVVFGENAYAWGVALDVELRDDGIKELGRKHTIGWYGIWGTGIVEPKNIVKILSAAAA